MKFDNIGFDPLFPLLTTLSITVIITVVLLVIEWRKSTRFKIYRCIALVIIILSILALLLRPHSTYQGRTFGILLTKNFDPKIIDSLQTKEPGLKIFTAPGISFPNATELMSWNELEGLPIAIIHGEGFPSFISDLSLQKKFQFIPSSNKQGGIMDLSVPVDIKANRSYDVSGIFYNPGGRNKLLLEGPSRIEDSVSFNQEGYHSFQLSFEAKSPGKYIFQLSSPISKEELPIIINPDESLNILLIQHYPTFESQQLKKLLARRHNVIVRYQVSKSTFRYEAINRNLEKIDRLNQEKLSQFSLVIIDSDELQSLSAAERNGLISSMRDGLGVIVLFNEDPSKIRNLRYYTDVQFASIKSDTAQFTIADEKIILPTWPVQAEQNDELEVTMGNKLRALAMTQRRGFGKIGFHLLQETYSLALKGDTTTYQLLWSDLIENISRKQTVNTMIRLQSKFPFYEDEPLSFVVHNVQKNPEIMHGGEDVPLRQDEQIEYVWSGKIWPRQSGWDSLYIKNDSSAFYFYVSKENSWSALRSRQDRATTSFIANAQSTEGSTVILKDEIPQWIFFMSMLLSAAFLWIAPKL